MTPGERTPTAYFTKDPILAAPARRSFDDHTIALRLPCMTRYNSIPLAQGLTLAGNRYMTLQADISHVFGKKVPPRALPPCAFESRHSLTQGAEGIVVAKTRQTVPPPPPPDNFFCFPFCIFLLATASTSICQRVRQVIVCLLDLEKLDIRSSGEAVLKLMQVRCAASCRDFGTFACLGLF
jgi:hypothetical protein